MAYRINDSCCLCGACIGVCPVMAIADNNGKAVIDESKCIDCGFCLENCPVDAPEQIQVVDIMAFKITERCVNCGTCENVCPNFAIDFVDDRYKINMELCLGCGVCAGNCPMGAIEEDY